jgi:hypothetical protein
MALKKVKEVKGVECNYWKIFRNDQNAVNDSTCVRLALYPSKEIRDKDVNNFVETQAFVFEGIDYTREQLYVKIKASNLVEVEPAIKSVEAKEAVIEIQSVVVQEAKDAVLDEEGNVLEEAQPEIVEERPVIIEPAIEAVEGKDAVFEESNWFFDAEDIL